MTSSVKAVVVGLGIHGQGIVRAAADAGIEIVGAVDPGHAGRGLGDLVGRPELPPLEVVATVADLAWDTAGADITLVAAKLDVPPLVDLVEEILGHGTDVITIVEDMFDLVTFDPERHARLDTAAVAAGRTVVATGVQDVAWTGLVVHATALLRDLTSIRIHQHLGVDGYPREFVEWVGIGLSRADFEAAADEARKSPSVLGAVLPVLARRLGLTTIEETREMAPYVIDEPLESVTLERVVPAGEPIGRRDVVTLRTAEGIDLVAELVTSAVMGRDDFRAVLDGEPRVEIDHRLIPGNLVVDATLVNRIPDVIAARPGVVATVDLPSPRFRPRVTVDPAAAPALEGLG